MALGLGAEHLGGGGLRVQLPRYVDWLITTPLLLLDVILLAKPLLDKGWGWDAMTVVGFDMVMIVAGVISALVGGSDRWVWFWVSTAAFAVVGSYVVLLFLRARAITEPRVTAKLRVVTAYLSVFWLIYPFVFALYYGGVITAGTEALVYMLLDLGAKVGFGFLLLLGPAVELVEHAGHGDVSTPRATVTATVAR